jgi:hypothetical protein
MTTRRPPFPLILLALIAVGLTLAVAASYAGTNATPLHQPVLTYTKPVNDTMGYICQAKLCGSTGLTIDKHANPLIVPVRGSKRSEVTVSGLGGFYAFNTQALSDAQLRAKMHPLLDEHSAVLIIDGHAHPTRVQTITWIRPITSYTVDTGKTTRQTFASFTIAPVKAKLATGLHTVRLQMIDDAGNPVRSPKSYFGFATVHLAK